MNIGTGITIALVSFASFIGYLAFIAFQQNVDLVAPDYYDQEIKYQEVIDGANNTKNLSKSVNWMINDGGLKVELPTKKEDKIEGEIKLIRSSNKELDIIQPFTLENSNIINVDKENFASGPYILKISWTTNGEKYYYENRIVF